MERYIKFNLSVTKMILSRVIISLALLVDIILLLRKFNVLIIVAVGQVIKNRGMLSKLSFWIRKIIAISQTHKISKRGIMNSA